MALPQWGGSLCVSRTFSKLRSDGICIFVHHRIIHAILKRIVSIFLDSKRVDIITGRIFSLIEKGSSASGNVTFALFYLRSDAFDRRAHHDFWPTRATCFQLFPLKPFRVRFRRHVFRSRSPTQQVDSCAPSHACPLTYPRQTRRHRIDERNKNIHRLMFFQ